MSKALFSDDSDGEEGNTSSSKLFSINKSYANHYDKFRKKEEMQRLKDAKGELQQYESDGSISGESTDDELAKPTGRTLEYLASALEAVKAGKAKSVRLDNKFYSDIVTAPDGVNGTVAENKKTKDGGGEGVYTLERHRRELAKLMEHAGDDDLLHDEDPEPRRPKRMKKHLLTVDNSDSDEDIVAVKTHTQASSGQQQEQDISERLTAALHKPGMTEDDKWLAEFFCKQQREVQDEQHQSSSSEDELPLTKINRPPPPKENMHGFVYEDKADTMCQMISQFQESGNIQRPQSYPAVIDSSVRIKDQRRKQQRLKTKERKAAEKLKLRQEIKQLQAIKKKEIMERLAKIQKITGQDNLAFGEDDLDEDFDPDVHDRKMQEFYSDHYYKEEGADDKKPQFEWDEAVDGDLNDYDDYAVGEGEEEQGEEKGEGGENAERACEDNNDYNQEEAQVAPLSRSRRRRGGKKKKHLTEALRRKKPLFDPSHHNYDTYFDEYYSMDFEDVIGDIKCRFKYKQVEPNNFGLTTGEILCADDKELNRWYSIKNLLRGDRTTDEERMDAKFFTKKANNDKIKQKILPSLYTPPEEEKSAVIDEAAAEKEEQESKRRKNLKKKLRRERKAAEEAAEQKKLEITEEPLINDSEETHESNISKKRKRDLEDEPTDEQTKEPKPKKEKRSDESKSKIRRTEDESSRSKTKKKLKKDKKKKLKDSKSKVEKSTDHPKKDRSGRKALSDDPYNTVLLLTGQRLAQYSIKGPAKLVSQAKYRKRQQEYGLVAPDAAYWLLPDDKKKLSKKNKALAQRKMAKRVKDKQVTAS